MNRNLTFEETNFIKAAIQFYIENGPRILKVADYSSSYPNEPEKANVIWEVQKAGKQMIMLLDEDLGDYREMIDNFILCQPDDLWDHLNMVNALLEATYEMQQKVMHIQKEIDESNR